MVTEADKPVVLLGFMGSGKTTLGKQLAEALGWIFIDLDRFIETQENRTIPEIFETDGEAAFRKLESKALNKVLTYPHQVVAVGGGAPCYSGNLEVIKEKSLSIYLKISERQLLQRLVNSRTQRPLLKGLSLPETRSFIADLLADRENFYLQADKIIESDEITAGMILSCLTARV